MYIYYIYKNIYIGAKNISQKHKSFFLVPWDLRAGCSKTRGASLDAPPVLLRPPLVLVVASSVLVPSGLQVGCSKTRGGGVVGCPTCFATPSLGVGCCLVCPGSFGPPGGV